MLFPILFSYTDLENMYQIFFSNKIVSIRFFLLCIVKLFYVLHLQVKAEVVGHHLGCVKMANFKLKLEV